MAVKMAINKVLFITVFFSALFGAVSFASADLVNPLKSQTIAALIENIAKIVAQIGVPIAVIAIIYAGFLFVTARGNEKKLEDAKRVFFWAIIGTVVLLGSWGLANAIKSFIGQL